ncbi:MAG: CinA family protein, partial [Pseudacidovorax sp.]|nr:CinA family protein [Pseudacidovorax sp.]
MIIAPVPPAADEAPDLPALVRQLAELLGTSGRMLATAESCTGGLIAGACTDLA